MIRKVAILLALVLATCALATTASAALGGPGPTPNMKAYSTQLLK